MWPRDSAALLRNVSTATLPCPAAGSFQHPSLIYFHPTNTHPSVFALQAAKFQPYGQLPNIVGAVDCSEIEIDSSGDAYINRKSSHSLKLQVICDADTRTIDMATGYSGRWHDWRVFKESPIYDEIESGVLGAVMRTTAVPVAMPDGSDVRVPLQLVGDNAYMCKPYLLPAYMDSTAREGARRTFNYNHSKTRIVIERTFGILKSRWRLLRRSIDLDLHVTAHVVAACCILHNLCLEHNVQLAEQDFEEEQQPGDDGGGGGDDGAGGSGGGGTAGGSGVSHQEGETIRRVLMNF